LISEAKIRWEIHGDSKEENYWGIEKKTALDALKLHFMNKLLKGNGRVMF
jgi:hypothetical protein